MIISFEINEKKPMSLLAIAQYYFPLSQDYILRPDTKDNNPRDQLLNPE